MTKESYRPIEWVVGIIFWGVIALAVIGLLSSLFIDDSPTTPSNRSINNPASIDPYPGYRDGIDQDCADLFPRKNIWVGDYDPDNLDRDGDGWGCEG